MAFTATFLSTLGSSASKAGGLNSISGSKVVCRLFLPATTAPISRRCRAVVPRAAVSGTEKAAAAPNKDKDKDKDKQQGGNKDDERVVQVHSIEEFDGALAAAKDRLVVVEFAASHSASSSRMYPAMVALSRTCGDVDFLLVMGDESEATRELCRREGVAQVPHFAFYKGAEKVHDEEGVVGPDQLAGDVLYYGDNHQAVVQLGSRADVEALIDANRGKLVVLDVGLKHCGPCVKVYPTVVKLSRSMADSTVFARMIGDQNRSCMEFLRDMDVVEVPTFLFIRDGNIVGRYIGSGKGELVGEILRYNGIRVTY